MRLHHLGARIGPSLIAVLAGWAAALLATLPMQFVKIVGNTFADPEALLLALAQGTLIWALWTAAVAAGGWLCGLLPTILLIPETWLLQRRRGSIALAAAFGWLVVLVEFKVWNLILPYNTLAVRMFSLYSILLVVYTAVSAAVYLRMIASKRS